MIPLISENREAIAALCRKYRIKRLDLFGSAATGTFDPATSDLDFIVDLGDYGPDVANRYLDFIADLENLLEIRVDVLTQRSRRNPYLERAIENERELVYAAKDSEAAA